MNAAPFAPGQARPVFFAMCGDDCELFFRREDFNEKQKAEDRENRDLTSLLQVALMYMGKPDDQVAMFEIFLQEPWRGLLAHFNSLYRKVCGAVVPLENCRFYPHDSYYARAAAECGPDFLAGLYMVSGSNLAVHQSRDWWEVSKAVNSKMRLAEDAPGRGIPTPETLLTTRGALDGPEAGAFFDRHGGRLIMKIKGLAGARNVTAVSSPAECHEYLELFGPDTEVVLQERLDKDEWTEMTVDLTVSDTDIEITNVRRILFAEGLWVGNYLRDDLPLTERQKAALLHVGEYIRSLGYSAPEGLNCGIDYFVRGDDIRIIETNAPVDGRPVPGLDAQAPESRQPADGFLFRCRDDGRAGGLPRVHRRSSACARQDPVFHRSPWFQPIHLRGGGARLPVRLANGDRRSGCLQSCETGGARAERVADKRKDRARLPVARTLRRLPDHGRHPAGGAVTPIGIKARIRIRAQALATDLPDTGGVEQPHRQLEQGELPLAWPHTGREHRIGHGTAKRRAHFRADIFPHLIGIPPDGRPNPGDQPRRRTHGIDQAPDHAGREPAPAAMGNADPPAVAVGDGDRNAVRGLYHQSQARRIGPDGIRFRGSRATVDAGPNATVAMHLAKPLQVSASADGSRSQPLPAREGFPAPTLVPRH